jgi:hypothetical protein
VLESVDRRRPPCRRCAGCGRRDFTATAPPPRRHRHGAIATAPPPRRHRHGATTTAPLPRRHHSLTRGKKLACFLAAAALITLLAHRSLRWRERVDTRRATSSKIKIFRKHAKFNFPRFMSQSNQCKKIDYSVERGITHRSRGQTLQRGTGLVMQQHSCRHPTQLTTHLSQR